MSGRPKVGIDARMAAHTGIGTYIRHLLKSDPFRACSGFGFELFGWPLGDPPFPGAVLKPFVSPIYSAGEQLEYFFRGRDCQIWHAPHYNIPVCRGFRGRRLVVTIHDLIHWLFRGRFFPKWKAAYTAFMVRQVIRQADHIIAVSGQTRMDLVRYFKCPEEKVSVIHEAARPGMKTASSKAENRAALKRLELPPSFFLYVGSVKPHKNVDRLIRVYRDMKAEGKIRTPLVIAGRKDARYPPGYEILRDLEDGGGIYYRGKISDSDLIALYNEAFCLVHPALYEGFGLTPLEAMAAGTPVIASKSGSLPEICGEAALMVDPGDDRELEKAMAQIEKSPEVSGELRRKGEERVRLFDWAKTGRQTLEVYRRVLDGK